MRARPITREQFADIEAREPYWRGRWKYTEVALRLAQRADPKHVLEIGPNGRELFLGAHTMDVKGRATYLHDASQAPWPIADKRYDLAIALQVWEHLADPYAAWRELCRVAKHAVLSFPLGWDCQEDVTHHGITEDQIASWTSGPAPEVREIVDQRGQRPRLVCFWRFA